ncbi:uncharacterized protein BJ171DRAFT_524746 [Polychytrium aggregatum]|uniref:uncharacterized protein n=1 Tax=Polychytrium aggregatum TaxID=110093 RepID=UPI0022FE258F|nr:uncharacterized protein BJ171DRAFT_524746 [Polychytrium aggregatum]KAI9193662.1 hypothetical protein BJ171DRAFT_524746 [Polychytrium aggregatum]
MTTAATALIGHEDLWNGGRQRCLVTLNLPQQSRPTDIMIIATVSQSDAGNFTFYACDAVCPHSGGPLYLGDIEDLGSEINVVCPWHEYRFSLVSGLSTSCELFKANVYKVLREPEGSIYLDFGEGNNVSVSAIKFFSVDTPRCRKNPQQAKSDITVGNVANVQGRSDRVPEASGGPTTLTEWAVKILHSPDPYEKVRLTFQAVDLWNSESIEVGACAPPERPVRHDRLNFIAPNKTKRLGKGGSLESRIAILHSLANIEQWAIDLAWDIIARFSSTSVVDSTGRVHTLPREFFTDFVRVAGEEAKHFGFLQDRLEALGVKFGDLAVHAGLWESALETSDLLLNRLAIVHMVHEARGLDVNPQTISKFAKAGDSQSVEKLEIIHQDEITHVACGQRWFTWITALQGVDRYETFHGIVRDHFRGPLKPPFNQEDRLRAGLDCNFYLPLSERSG